MKTYIFYICILPIIYPNTAVAVKGYYNFVSQGRKDLDPNENKLIYSKAIRMTGK